MIYLITGANGSGKTLLTLRDVRAKSIKESRPVYHNGRFAPVAGGELDSWHLIDMKDWQSVPDGAIFFVDECHNDFPPRSSKDAVPEHVKMLAEHRRRGFDFYLICQHPLNFDAFVRRLIGSPGWHRHHKRASGAALVSVLEWSAVNEVCQKAGSGASAQTSMVAFPKEVYSWYTSTSLDTAKVKIPFQVKLLAVCLVVVPMLGWFAYRTFTNQSQARLTPVVPAAVPSKVPGSPSSSGVAHVQTSTEYLATFVPRVEGLPHTSPRYDDSTKATDAPFPAACVSMGPRCDCYSQQATKLPTSKELCLQIVKNGYFKDWSDLKISGASSGQSRFVSMAESSPAGHSPYPMVLPVPKVEPPPVHAF